jgi:hypothetical protein
MILMESKILFCKFDNFLFINVDGDQNIRKKELYRLVPFHSK